MVKRALLALVVVATAPRVAHADEPAARVSLAVAAGAALPAPASKLGAGLAVGVDAAWIPAATGGYLELALGVDASQRSARGHVDEATDAPGFDWRVVARELWIYSAARLRVPLGDGWSGRLGAGPALVLVETVAGGDLASAPFPDAEESSFVPGVRAGLGAEWRHDGGALAFELAYTAARIDHRATGADARIDAFGARVGYRFSF